MTKELTNLPEKAKPCLEQTQPQPLIFAENLNRKMTFHDQSPTQIKALIVCLGTNYTIQAQTEC